MKTRKWVIPVCIVSGVIVLCLVALLATAGIMSAKGYGVSIGRLYFADIGTYLIDSDDSAMLVSDQSKQQDLFSEYKNGDKILLIHDGVNESYPAQTGGYYIFRLAKGDGTYKPADEVIGVTSITQIGWHDRDAYLLNNIEKREFEAQYIRTDGYHENVEYPIVKIIRSAKELNAYYEEYKEMYNLERRENPASDSSIGFLDACDKYDEAYFEKQILVMVLQEEGSGSTRHKVDSVGFVGSEMVISIDTLVPEAGTDDMAEWHVLIEPEAGADVESEKDITVLLDGVNPLTQPATVRESKGYANISLTVPYGWEYETVSNDDSDAFSIDIWPAEHSDGKLSVKYYGSQFGVCGTGLEQKKITLGEYRAYKGTYDNKKVWDFISLIGTPGGYAVMNQGADVWWNEFGNEAMQILSTVKVAEGYIAENEAIELAKEKATVKYDDTRALFDSETGLWTISFYKKNTAGGDQVVVVTSEGKVIDVVYGE